jgi:hypothetical protein
MHPKFEFGIGSFTDGFRVGVCLKIFRVHYPKHAFIHVMPKKKKAKKKRTTPATAAAETKSALSAREPKNSSVRPQRHQPTDLSGDLQGLRRVPGADSQSDSELVDEGNPFEAEIISGVEAARDATKEVRTREVPEDDVPEEYLDKD